MKQKERLSIRYSIWDPSGNIAALVEMESLMPGGEKEDTAAPRRDIAPAEINTLKPSEEMEPTLAESEMQLAGGAQEVVDELRRDMPPLTESESQLPLTGIDSQQSDGAREDSPAPRKGMPPLAEIAAQIMKKHPEVEQVGFVRDITPPEEGIRAELFMAGGEFCGNAAMCAAAWYAEKNRLPDVPNQELYLKVSGAEEAVKVQLLEEEAGVYSGSVRMPAATGITYVRLQYGEVQGTLPLVRMQGISHLIIEEDSVFFHFLEDRERAEAMVWDQAEKHGLEGLGLMFLKKQGTTPCARKQSAECSLTPPVKKPGAEYSLASFVKKQEAKYFLTPLVYIRTAGTLFWENSCGSGSSACGIYLAEKEKQPVDLKLVQPGGVLCVRGDLQTGIRLSGRVKKTGVYEL